MQLSYLVFIYLLSASRGNFVMHFIYSQRQILIYRRDTASGPLHFASGKVTVREYARSHFILGRRGKKRKRGEKERNRTAVLLGTETLKRNATIPLMEFL